MIFIIIFLQTAFKKKFFLGCPLIVVEFLRRRRNFFHRGGSQNPFQKTARRYNAARQDLLNGIKVF